MSTPARINPFLLWFSQRTAGGNNRAQQLRRSIREKGFIDDPDNAVCVVRTPVSLTTLHNTRVAVTQEMDLSDIPIIIYEFDEPLPEIMVNIRRFGVAKTWGEALIYRTSRQHLEPLPPYGRLERPVMSPDEDM